MHVQRVSEEDAFEIVNVILPLSNVFFFHNDFNTYSETNELQEIHRLVNNTLNSPMFCLDMKTGSETLRPVIRSYEDVDVMLNYFSEKLDTLEKYINDNDKFISPKTLFKSQQKTPERIKEALDQIDTIQTTFNLLQDYQEKRLTTDQIEKIAITIQSNSSKIEDGLIYNYYNCLNKRN